MLGEALAAFGAGVAPPSPLPGDTAQPDSDQLAPVLLIGTVALGAVVVGGLLRFAQRRP